MKNIFTLFIAIILISNINAQNLKEASKALKNVHSLAQLEQLKTMHPYWNISVDKTLMSDAVKYPRLKTIKVGDTLHKQYFNDKKFILKVVEIKDVELCKVRYIYLNGKKYSKKQIDSIRKVILEKYKKGDKFISLANKYAMDGNKTGDLMWFYKGQMVDKFDKGVRHRKKGEIFTVDVPERDWYYVVLKTHKNKKAKLAISIKVEYWE